MKQGAMSSARLTQEEAYGEWGQVSTEQFADPNLGDDGTTWEA